MRIPCDVIARLSHVLPQSDDDPAMAAIRLDNGKVMATNRRFMAVEEVGAFEGVYYIAPDPKLIDICRTEAQYSSVIDFTPIDALKYTTAITTLGAKFAENIGVWPDGPTAWDNWRDLILAPCLEPLTATTGPMVFVAQGLAELAAASPSGIVVLEQFIDPMRPVVVRDVDSPSWVGFFRPKVMDGRHHASATVPEWCK